MNDQNMTYWELLELLSALKSALGDLRIGMCQRLTSPYWIYWCWGRRCAWKHGTWKDCGMWRRWCDVGGMCIYDTGLIVYRGGRNTRPGSTEMIDMWSLFDFLQRLLDSLGVCWHSSHLAITHTQRIKVKVKFSSPSVGPGADPGVQAVNSQVTISYPPGGMLPLLSARPAFYLRKRSPDGATTEVTNN